MRRQEWRPDFLQAHPQVWLPLGWVLIRSAGASRALAGPEVDQRVVYEQGLPPGCAMAEVTSTAYGGRMILNPNVTFLRREAASEVFEVQFGPARTGWFGKAARRSLADAFRNENGFERAGYLVCRVAPGLRPGWAELALLRHPPRGVPRLQGHVDPPSVQVAVMADGGRLHVQRRGRWLALSEDWRLVEEEGRSVLSGPAADMMTTFPDVEPWGSRPIRQVDGRHLVAFPVSVRGPGQHASQGSRWATRPGPPGPDQVSRGERPIQLNGRQRAMADFMKRVMKARLDQGAAGQRGGTARSG